MDVGSAPVGIRHASPGLLPPFGTRTSRPVFTMIFPNASPWDDPPDPPSDGDFVTDNPPPDPLVRCPDCRGSVGSRRRFCPHCWAEMPRRKRSRPARPLEDDPPVRFSTDRYGSTDDEKVRPEARPVEIDLPVLFPVDYSGLIDVSQEIPEALPVAARVAVPVCRETVIPIAPPRRRRPRPAPPRPSRLGPMFAGYAIMLGMMVAFAVAMVAAMLHQGEMAEEDLNWGTAGIEVLCAMLVLVVAVVIGRLPSHRPTWGQRVGAWVGGVPILALLLALNFGFTALLRWVFKVEAPTGPGLTIVTFFLVCVQPAVIEEWFFRYLALGSLREAVGMHGAVLISGAMFGIAHIFNPLGIPYLILVGVCLGYLRVWSGSLALPVLLHFVHNFVVVISERVV